MRVVMWRCTGSILQAEASLHKSQSLSKRVPRIDNFSAHKGHVQQNLNSCSGQPIPLVIVDAANNVGRVPDGWWNNRHKANERLRDALQGFKDKGFDDRPGPVDLILVVEGMAKTVRSIDGVRVEAAEGSGDRKILDLINEYATQKTILVTSDNRLAQQACELGVEVRPSGSVPRGTKPSYRRRRNDGTACAISKEQKDTAVHTTQ